MSTETAVKTSAITESAFPAQQSVIEPGAGTGNAELYLAGAGGTSISLYYSGSGGNVQVYYGQNYTYPNIPLPVGISQYALANGFNLLWTSDGSPFKVVWGVS